MQPIQVSAIALGNWNPKVFTPAWVKERLLDIKDESEIEVLLDFTDMDFALKYKNLIVSPKRNILELQIKSFEKEDTQLFTIALIRIFDLLPQTPVKGIGINFIYSFSNDESKRYLSLMSKEQYFKNFDVTMTRYTLKKEMFTTNIIIEKTATASAKITFNYHYNRSIDFEKGFFDRHFDETQKLLSNGF